MNVGGEDQNDDDRPGGDRAARPRFPALDPEPPPRSATRQVALASVVIVVAAALTAGGFGLADITSNSPRPSSHLDGGQVVILTTAGEIALVTPGQAKAEPVPGLGTYHQIPPLPSGDGRFLVGPDGTVIALSPHGLKVQPTAVRINTSTQHPPYTDALADHDRAMVILSQVAASTDAAVTHVSVAPLGTGQLTDLGIADGAAGDPQAPGAFVSVPPSVAPPASVNPSSGLSPDDRVELRDVGRRPVILGTAASFNRALHQPANQVVSLFAVPDAAGDKIAITVSPVSGPQTEGVVIVDRAGRVLTTLPSMLGAGLSTGVSWSPDASAVTFAVNTSDGAGAGLGVFRLTGQFTNRQDPQAGVQPGGCDYSPDGATILCQVLEPENETGWDEAPAQSGAVQAIPAPGQFLAWLPDPGTT